MGEDVRKRNVRNIEEGLEEDGNKREWKLLKEREHDRIEGKGGGREGRGKGREGKERDPTFHN